MQVSGKKRQRTWQDVSQRTLRSMRALRQERSFPQQVQKHKKSKFADEEEGDCSFSSFVIVSCVHNNPLSYWSTPIL